MTSAFDWDDHPDAPDAAPAAKSSKFNWDDHPDAAPATPGLFDGVTKSAIDSLPMIGGVAGGILGTPADAIAGPMGNVAGAAVGGYVGTAAKNLINRYYDPASAPQTQADAMTQPIIGGAEQGLMQGAGEAASPYIGKVLKAGADASKWAGTKLLSSLGGASPDVIKEYAQYADRINSAPTVGALKDVSDDFVGKLADDVDAKKLSLDQASDAFKGYQSDLKDQYRSAGLDAREAVSSAQQTLKDAHNARIENLSGDIYDTVNKLKTDVQTGSGNALDTLDKSGAKVDLNPMYAQIDSTIDKMKAAGTDDSLAVADKLQDYKARHMGENWANIDAPGAKKLIQGLDQMTTYSPMAGSFDQAKNAAFKGVRSALDQTLKDTVPAYKAAMLPVSADSDLLSRVSDFGDKSTAASALGRINSPNQLENRTALQQLGQKYGADYVAAAQPENLPEQAILNRAQGAQDALRPDRVANKIDQTLSNSREKDALNTAQSQYQGAQDKLAPFKPLAPNGAGQTQAQQKLEQLGKGKNIELTDMFQKLGGLTDTNFVQAMKDQNTLAAFQKGATNGSRNTMMGALTGFAFGGVGGAAIGGTAGRAVDQWGPAVTKQILDGAIKVSKAPSVEAISQLSLPNPIKKQMIAGLENYMTQGGQAGAQALPAVAASDQPVNRSPAKGPDAWANQGLQKLGINDADLTNSLLKDPKAKQLLIQASDLAPGSKAMKQIMNQIQKGWGQP